MKLTEIKIKVLHVQCGRQSGLKIWSLLAQKMPLLLLFQLQSEERSNSLANRG